MANFSPMLVPRWVPRSGGEKIEVRGGWISFVAVGEQTGGAYALIETANQPSTGVPLHVHEREDETWFVLEGEYVFRVGDQTLRAQAGDYVFGPRNVPHRYANQGTAVARALIMVTPAGFEGFWRESTLLRGDVSATAHEALYADPARLKMFLAAMTGLSRGANLAIAQKVPWSKYQTFADVGTAQGDLAVQVALANPHLGGIGFDLAEVGPIFEEYVKQHGLSERLSFRAGNFFEDPMPKVDVVTMGHILHDWNLEEKKMLLRKVYEAISPGGAVVAYDSVIDDDRSQNTFGLMSSLNMLIETPGGFDYTGADCMGWMKETGFRETRVEHLVGPVSMVVGIK